jgi:four helix bundle protein
MSRDESRTVWQKSRSLVAEVYALSHPWPATERFGVTSQIRRAVVSIPANIPEGYGRTGSRELRHHVSIAHGSLSEVETLLYLSVDLGFCYPEDVEPVFQQCAEVGRMLTALITRLTSSASTTN